MTSGWNDDKWNAALDKVLERSTTDAEFRKLCLSDAHAAIEKASGQPLPREVRIRFTTEASEMAVRLPDFRGSGELSDEELESVAGGLCISTTSFCTSSKCSNVCFAHTKFCF
jgi:hypothetical protein